MYVTNDTARLFSIAGYEDNYCALSGVVIIKCGKSY